MQTSQAGIDLIKGFEGVRLLSYKLPGEKYWTIGYGHSGQDVEEGEVITRERAEELLRLDLQKFERYVERYVTDIPLTQNRFDALVSYTYNRGPGKLKSDLAAHCHTVEEYSEGITRYWGSATRYKNALMKRRYAERELFDKDAPPKKTEAEMVREILDGKWGVGLDRKRRLIAAGYDPYALQKAVNAALK